MTTLPIANVVQPLIDVFDSILVFFHDSVGFSWGFSIIALTIVVRAALIPLTLKQFKSMQALQRLAPDIKELQAKYKDDKQRLNQEMMKFYQENKVNPFGSCLPLVLQLPVFFSLFYMLRKDLKLDICPGIGDYAIAHHTTITPRPATRSIPAARASCSSTTSPRRRPARPGGPAHPLRRLAVAVERADVGHGGPQPAHDHDRAAVRVRAVHHPLPGRADRVLDHDELLDRRPAVRDPANSRLAGAGRARARGRGSSDGDQARPRAQEGARQAARRRPG